MDPKKKRFWFEGQQVERDFDLKDKGKDLSEFLNSDDTIKKIKGFAEAIWFYDEEPRIYDWVFFMKDLKRLLEKIGNFEKFVKENFFDKID